MNLLFICSKNKWRSRTAETIFKKDPIHFVKSAGTKEDAKVRINKKLLQWADIIFAVEIKHKKRILEKYNDEKISSKIIVLDISDEYQYMNSELIDILKTSVSPYLK